MLLIEKPLAFSFEEAKEIVQIGKDNNIPIAVNYIRDFEPSHREFVEKVKDGELGIPLKIICWYSKGIKNNGSHFFQLISKFLGDTKNINVIDKGKKLGDYDFEPTLEINYENGECYFIPVDEENFSLFEMELVGPKGKIKYYNGGSHYDLWHIRDDPIFKNYTKLSSKPITTKMDIKKYQYHIYSNIADYLKGETNLYCEGKTALKTAYILNQIEWKILNEK